MRFAKLFIVVFYLYSISCNSNSIKTRGSNITPIPNLPLYGSDTSSPFVKYVPDYNKKLQKKIFKLDDLISGYKDDKLNQKYLRAVARMYPKVVRYYHIGRTRNDRPIPALRITAPTGKMDEKVSILFDGAHHANELLSTEHCYDILYNLLSDYEKYRKYLRYVVIWIVPIVNPDGSNSFWHKSIGTGRKNGYTNSSKPNNIYYDGVDLNRNYPFRWGSGIPKASSADANSAYFRGLQPASEPETKAMMKLAKIERFVASVSFHQYASCILYPYTIPDAKNPEPDYAKDLAIRLANLVTVYRENKKFIALKNIYAVDGVDQDYFYNKYGTLAYIIESTHHNVDYRYTRTILSGFKPLWERLIRESIIGKKIFLKIMDVNTKKAVSARVKIDEIQFFEKEKPRSNPKNGLFYWLVKERKEYHLKISKKGYYARYILYKALTSREPQVIYLNLKK
ncbi:MAG: peptidase M14 [Leptospiraceae bacterium]|nr:peptidase M14 [Leptospiraceae bacterium]